MTPPKKLKPKKKPRNWQKEAKEWKLAAETWTKDWKDLIIRVQKQPEFIQKEIRKR